MLYSGAMRERRQREAGVSVSRGSVGKGTRIACYRHNFFPLSVGSELIVEWRALTVALITEISNELKKSMGLNLAQVLEGGTWRAGRIVAKEKRADGGPPIRIRSDGTVF